MVLFKSLLPTCSTTFNAWFPKIPWKIIGNSDVGVTKVTNFKGKRDKAELKFLKGRGGQNTLKCQQKWFLIRFLVKYVHFAESMKFLLWTTTCSSVLVLEWTFKTFSNYCLWYIMSRLQVHFEELALYFTSIGFVIFQTAWVDLFNESLFR